MKPTPNPTTGLPVGTQGLGPGETTKRGRSYNRTWSGRLTEADAVLVRQLIGRIGSASKAMRWMLSDPVIRGRIVEKLGEDE